MSSFNACELIDFNKPSLYISVASVLFNPIFWNIVARAEYKSHILTKLAGGNKYYGCYALALTIFSLGIIRDELFKRAITEQPQWDVLADPLYSVYGAGAFFGIGSILVVSSMWALGVTGTYLGDYFGILMDDKVETFPFNVTANPMYYGSTMCFIGTSLWYKSFAGLAVSAIVFVEYKIALLFEEPFTGEIYAARERKRAEVAKKSATSGKSTAVQPRAEL